MSTTSGARPTAVSASSPQSGAYTRSVRRFSSLGRKASMPSRSILRRLTRRMLELASSCSIFVAPDRLGATPLTEVYKCTQHRHSENADLCQRSADRQYAAVHYYLSRSGEQKRKKRRRTRTKVGKTERHKMQKYVCSVPHAKYRSSDNSHRTRSTIDTKKASGMSNKKQPDQKERGTT